MGHLDASHSQITEWDLEDAATTSQDLGGNESTSLRLEEAQQEDTDRTTSDPEQVAFCTPIDASSVTSFDEDDPADPDVPDDYDPDNDDQAIVHGRQALRNMRSAQMSTDLCFDREVIKNIVLDLLRKRSGVNEKNPEDGSYRCYWLDMFPAQLESEVRGLLSDTSMEGSSGCDSGSDMAGVVIRNQYNRLGNSEGDSDRSSVTLEGEHLVQDGKDRLDTHPITTVQSQSSVDVQKEASFDDNVAEDDEQGGKEEEDEEEGTEDNTMGLSIREDAVEVLHNALEACGVELFELAVTIAVHCGREHVTSGDLKLAWKIIDQYRQ